ncbi:MAG: pyruvate kinase [Oscillospiraceae bacterium]|nr:pyruvate kinase [Oscillospiraceae bacterium]
MPEIYGTLGPRCSDPATLRAMLEAGMSGVRLNLSHITLHDAALQIKNLQRAALQCGKKAQLLIDMQGPELRIGALSRPLTLIEGEEALFGEGGVPVPAMVLPCLVPGQQLLLDDGKLLLEVVSGGGRTAQAKVLRGGVLQSRKSLALPGCALHPPTMTQTDHLNLSLAAEYGVTGVMQPFVRDRADLEAVRAALDQAGGSHIHLFAKIENREGVANLDELIPACDEIVIARGDLGNAMPLWELPRVQKEIAAKCRAAGRDFMVVTQMLYTMEHAAVPTRAEVSDVFNAIVDGAASVMLTGETAVGEYPVEAIRYMAKTVAEAVRYLESR